MPWRFVGRTEQLNSVCRGLADSTAGPVIITGMPGMGRTTLIAQALSQIGPSWDRILRVTPGAAAPDVTPWPASPRSGSPRTLVVADDAHLLDDSVMLALRSLSRSREAVLLVSRPVPADTVSRPDPTYCLSYEPGVRTILLSPLTETEVSEAAGILLGGPVHPATAEALQAATGGNPRLLRAMLYGGLADSMTWQRSGWTIAEPGTGGKGVSVAPLEGLEEGIRDAWSQLAVERLDQLCKIALWSGQSTQVAAIWPFLLLLGGSPDEAITFIDSLGDRAVAEIPQLALIRAMTLALGMRQPALGARFLLGAAGWGTEASSRMLAYRAWLLTLIGRAADAAAALAVIAASDRETALFVHAARAGVARMDGQAAETVFHLRRALATAESCDACPWMIPYLRDCLTEALVVSGRTTEAKSLTTTRSWMRDSASARYVADILRALAACSKREVGGIPA